MDVTSSDISTLQYSKQDNISNISFLDVASSDISTLQYSKQDNIRSFLDVASSAQTQIDNLSTDVMFQRFLSVQVVEHTMHWDTRNST